MAKKTRPKLTPELQQKYDAWLRQQKGAGGIGYITGDDEAGAPVASSDVEAESVERGLGSLWRTAQVLLERLQQQLVGLDGNIFKNNRCGPPANICRLHLPADGVEFDRCFYAS